MDYDNFVTEFLLALKNNDKRALTLLEENKNIIGENLGENANLETIDNFINFLINNIVQNKNNNFDIIKKVLKHDTMTTVYKYFINSNAMIKAVQAENKNALKWLQSMKVSPYVQDENGMNVLMHAIQNMQWDSYIKPFISDKKCTSQEDNNGRTALFYSLNNITGLWKLVESGIDINHKDHFGNTILLYCCKTNKLNHIKYFIKQKVNVNAIDNEERTVAMYLAMNGYYTDAKVSGTTASLFATIKSEKYSTFQNLQKAGCNFNYINSKGESVLSLLLKHMYESNNPKKFNSYICTLLSLMFVDCDFNIPIDEDKNTALMIFILANDWDTFDFLMKHRKDLDLTKENKNGESATSLFMKNKKTNLYYYPIDYRTFNLDYDDPTNGNNILMFSVMTRPDFIPNILSKRPDLINEINNKGENALMIACKANNYDSVSSLLNYSIPINNQDELGNTALHYAIGCKNPIIVQELIQKGINDQLKNNEGKTANDLAMELGDKNILKALKNQLTSEDIKNIKNI